MLQGERGEMKYEVRLIGDGIATCWCQKPQLTGIPCDHVLAVCSFRRLDHIAFISPYYSMENYVNTWAGHWAVYGNKNDWPLYTGSIIRPDPKKINKGRRRKIRIPMVMDEMEGRISRLPSRGRGRSGTRR
jgi:hypothetical protein